MLYLIAEDEYYYSESGLSEIRDTYKIDNIEILPELENIKNVFEKGKIEKTCFLAPYSPFTVSPRFKQTSFFEIVYLKNKFGFLTTGQKKRGISEREAMEEKLGVRIYEPKETLADYAGAERLREELLVMEEKEKFGLPIKGFMLTGIPGTGKSFFAKCAAGEVNRKLVELNLSIFMEMENGLQALEQFFEFFTKNTGRYIIWIDEIEKMFVGESSIQMLGTLLTKLNDLNGSNAESSFFFIATANNISDMSKKNPEFFRNGRFDVLVFIMNPEQSTSKDMFNLYKDKFNSKFKNDLIPTAIQMAAENIRPRENSLMREIVDTINREAKNCSLDALVNVKKDVALKHINNTPELKNIANRIEKDFSFEFDEDAFMLSAISLYGSESTMFDRYVHTPAEIAFIVEDAFSQYYFSEKEIDLDTLAGKYQPLQVTMSDAIEKMLGIASRFVKI